MKRLLVVFIFDGFLSSVNIDIDMILKIVAVYKLSIFILFNSDTPDIACSHPIYAISHFL